MFGDVFAVSFNREGEDFEVQFEKQSKFSSTLIEELKDLFVLFPMGGCDSFIFIIKIYNY